MLHFYEDTLAAGAEELADYTDHMEHLTGVFDHYLNLMDILGKTKDYDAMGDFLGGRADTLRDRLDVAKEYYDVMLNQKADVEKELNDAIRSGDEESVKFWQEQWDAIVDATDEAQEQVLSLTEEWAEAMRATIDNNMARIKDTLEKTLTDGMGFDFLMEEFDRLNTRQEEYLTKTNQIYETNKLIRQASQKID
jgi:F0F1-type ATP synthase membrane subunit b/b'